jgi:hypothetical protein
MSVRATTTPVAMAARGSRNRSITREFAQTAGLSLPSGPAAHTHLTAPLLWGIFLRILLFLRRKPNRHVL